MQFLWKLIIITLLSSTVLSAQTKTQKIGTVEISGYSEMTITKTQVILSGPRVEIKTKDGTLGAKASKIVLTFATGAAPGGIGSLKTASLSGNVWLLIRRDSDRITEATSNNADVDLTESRQAVLSGNVIIKTTDPSLFVGPMSVTADKATISLKPDAQMQPGEPRIKVESDPGRSRIEFTPKSQEKTGGEK